MSETILSPDAAATEEPSRLYTRWRGVTVSHIEYGNPLHLTFVIALTLDNGAIRHFSKAVWVTDAILQERLRREVRPGDHIRVHLETDWADADIPTVLKDFCLS